MTTIRKRKCHLCGEQYEGFGNNAWPWRGRCCDECNEQAVAPVRLVLFQYEMKFLQGPGAACDSAEPRSEVAS
jgi:hypothetical protein